MSPYAPSIAEVLPAPDKQSLRDRLMALRHLQASASFDAMSVQAEQLHRDAQLDEPDASVMAHAAAAVAMARYNLRDFEASCRWAGLAVKDSEAVTDADDRRECAAKAYALNASSLAELDRPVEALQLMQRASRLVGEGVSVEARRLISMSSAFCFHSLGMPLPAYYGVLEALRTIDEASSPPMAAVMRANLVWMAMHAHRQIKAIEPAHADALVAAIRPHVGILSRLLPRLTTPLHRMLAYDAQACLALLEGRAAEALGFIDVGLMVLRDASSSFTRIEQHLLRAEAAKALGQDEAFVESVEQAEELLAEGRSNGSELGSRLPARIQLAVLKGAFDEALLLHRRYHAYVSRNEQAVVEARMSDLKSHYETQNLRGQIDALKQENVGLGQQYKTLYALAMTDPLTQVSNRRAIEQRYRSTQSKGRLRAVLLLDADHFKQINDRFKHATGDRVLQVFAAIVAQTLRDQDAVGRMGGEEFVVLLSDMSIEQAQVVAERVRVAVQDHPWDDVAEGLRVTVSGGVVCTRRDESFEAAIDRADECMYRAKAQGRNRIVTDMLDAAVGD